MPLKSCVVVFHDFGESSSLSSMTSKISVLLTLYLTLRSILTSNVLNPKDRLGVIGAHLMTTPKVSSSKTPEISGSGHRTRPPITTHVLDVARGSPASGMEVHLEMWKGTQQHPSFTNRESRDWELIGSSITNTDGRSGPLMGIVDYITPGFYRISFNTGNYAPSGFFPYVSLVFQVRENQRAEHFHVPLLHSPFSFTTYRGS